MRRVAYENMRDLSFIVQELKTLMATDWSLVRLQVPGLVIMADDGAGTVYTVYTVHRPCCTLGLVFMFLLLVLPL